MPSGVRVSMLGLSVASVAMLVIRKHMKGQLRAFSQVGIRTTPPVLPEREHFVGFGKIEGPNRGENPMEIPLYLRDPYYYARDDTRTNSMILGHLDEENKYTNYKTQHLETARESLYKELLSHVQETDAAYPYPHGKYLYYTRTEKGKSYRIRCRKLSTPADAAEEILFDENEMAKGLSHFDMRSAQPSPDHDLIAYAVDTQGYETYTAFIKDLTTGKLLKDELNNTSGQVVWGKDRSTLYYSTMDEAHRVHKVWRHRVGTDSKQDECLYMDDDEVFSAFFGKTRSGRYLLIGSSSSETTEYHVLDLEDPNSKLQLAQPREFGVQYSMDHHGDYFYIVTNRDKATNFKLMRTPVDKMSGGHWREFIPYNSKIKTDFIECFRDYIVIVGREDGLSQIWVREMTKNKKIHRLEFEEPLYTVEASVNKEYDTTRLRFTYSSLVTPVTTFDYDMDTHEKVFLKQTPCPNYDPSLYAMERFEATSRDGTTIPMSVVYRKDKVSAFKSQPRPVHLYGYGSYEICIDPDFRTSILPLLDHGVTYVIAHIRGGGEMGRSWYEDAKYKTKKKTFEDFVDCAQHLVSTKYTAPNKLTCEGRSAGGLLMGAVLNMRPDLFQAAVAGVPFVDVMNSMCDSTIPLTTGEWEEWGNPNTEEYFNYMLSYSPYENVRAQAYPNILVTSGLYDPRVAYWEPTKWVAKLRRLKTDQNEILLKMDMSSGHFSASDRYHYLREKAFDIAYLLDQLQLLPRE